MVKKREDGIHFGPFAPPLLEQLSPSSLPISMLRDAQRDVDAITHLRLRGIIPESVAHRAYRRVANRLFEKMREE